MNLLLAKIKEKNNLPILLFFVFFIQILPLFISNFFTKEAYGVKTIVSIIGFVFEIIILIYTFIKNKENINMNKGYIISVLCLFFFLLIVQVKNVLQKDFYILDIFNIGCILINIVLFFIVLYDFKINNENIKFFFKGICIISVISAFWNLILYNKEILASIGIFFENFDYSYANNVKSFWGNRNSLAFFINLAIISACILMQMDEKKSKKYKSLILFFIFAIWCTHSKTSFITTIFFIELLIISNTKITIKKRMLICFLVGIISLIIFLNILGRLPNLNNGSPIYISDGRLQRLSGRKMIWKSCIELLNESPINYLFGVGRFNSLEVIKFENKSYSQFHNLYLDIILTGGIVQLVYILFIYSSVIRKILKSKLKIEIKRIYICMYISYAIYIFFESYGRFSIGWSDTLCMIFLIAIPLLHANSYENKLDK